MTPVSSSSPPHHPRLSQGINPTATLALRNYLHGRCHFASNPLLGSNFFMYLRRPSSPHDDCRLFFMPDGVILAWANRTGMDYLFEKLRSFGSGSFRVVHIDNSMTAFVYDATFQSDPSLLGPELTQHPGFHLQDFNASLQEFLALRRVPIVHDNYITTIRTTEVIEIDDLDNDDACVDANADIEMNSLHNPIVILDSNDDDDDVDSYVSSEPEDDPNDSDYEPEE